MRYNGWKQIFIVIICIICTLCPVTATVMPIDGNNTVRIPVRAVCLTGNFSVSVFEYEGMGISMALENDEMSLSEAFLTEKDKKMLSDGDGIHVDITVSPFDYEFIKDIIEATQRVEEGQAKFSFDITVQKTEKTGQYELTDTLEYLDFSFNAPPNFTADSVQNAKIVSVHQTGVDSYQVYIYPITYNTTSNKISFKTRLFSPYVLIYQPEDNSQNEHRYKTDTEDTMTDSNISNVANDSKEKTKSETNQNSGSKQPGIQDAESQVPKQGTVSDVKAEEVIKNIELTTAHENLNISSPDYSVSLSPPVTLTQQTDILPQQVLTYTDEKHVIKKEPDIRTESSTNSITPDRKNESSENSSKGSLNKETISSNIEPEELMIIKTRSGYRMSDEIKPAYSRYLIISCMLVIICLVLNCIRTKKKR